MKKIGIFTFSIFLAGSLSAQTINDGKKMLEYERFQSAASIFKGLLDKDPKNTDAAYWLGQTYIQNFENADTAAAKTLYQTSLQASPNDALLMVGVGEIELMQGKTADARNRFEAALSLVKKKAQIPILMAIGRANIDTRAGDVPYAISKLNDALKLDGKNPDIYEALGDAYRKIIDGGNAVTNYQTALSFDPKDARASFMIGRIYETQGIGQESIYMKYYNDAIQEDPAFAPVYYWLYMYYYRKDVNKAREYLDLYVKNTDPNSKLCYAEASLFYVSKMYKQAIAKADGCIEGSVTEKPFPNLYGLKAYAYEKLNDKENAKKYFEEFFSKVNPDLLGATDYATYGKVLLLYPGQEALAEQYIDKAIGMDTVKATRFNMLLDIAKDMYAKKDYAQAGVWFTKILSLDPANLTKTNLYWAGISDFNGSNYKGADSIFHIYQNKFPEDLLGWYYGAQSNAGIDSTSKLGLAKPYWDKLIAIADTMQNKEPAKNMLIPAYRYMVAYYYLNKNNVDSAYFYTNKILEISPNDPNALDNKTQFEAYLKKLNSSAGKKDN